MVKQSRTGSYFEGTKVKLTAFAHPGYEFKQWSGGISDTINPTFITMNSDKNVLAEFVKQDSTECLIGNPGFESGIFSWINHNNAELTEDANSGLWALKCSEAGDFIDDALIPVSDHSYFTFSFYSKKSSGTGRAFVGIEFLDENKNRITAAQSQNFTYEYEEKVIEKEIPNRTVYIRVFINKQTDDGSIFVDDFCLKLWENNPNAFLLTVENGTGSGYYEPKTLVTVNANPPEEDYRFLSWIGDTVYMTNPGSMFSRFLMPDTSMTITANYESTVGIDDLLLKKSNKVKIYPNPANKYFYVEGMNKFNYRIFNSQGVEVLSGKNNDYQKIITKTLPSGLYYVSLKSVNTEVMNKLIIRD